MLSEENIYTVRTQLYNKGAFLLILDSIVEAAKVENDSYCNMVKIAFAYS